MRNDFGVKPGNTRFPYKGGMKKDMRKGATFKKSHIKAMRKVGV